MKFLYVLGFALSAILVTAQTQQTPQTMPASPSTPAGTATPSTSGGVAGNASSSTGQSPEAQNPSGGISVMTDADLEGQIQNALSKEPTLAGDSAHVAVSGDTIELTGTVGTNKEKTTATRIVQSYSGSKKLVNRLTIGGKNQKASPPRPTVSPDRVRQPEASAPASNLEPGKGNPPSTPTPPQF